MYGTGGGAGGTVPYIGVPVTLLNWGAGTVPTIGARNDGGINCGRNGGVGVCMSVPTLIVVLVEDDEGARTPSCTYGASDVCAIFVALNVDAFRPPSVYKIGNNKVQTIIKANRSQRSQRSRKSFI